ncbi:hypothetical protein [Methylobacterium nodulans]|uniref:Uncharacterized protein n=1 Tax=Methylobacterium nodulans (strain LMG 21967 / CNCM I-2342 / ORS 2060) TaxID=460265 RepID=B8IBD7_METNO|nr:hypothetical protein [Methylobacterium nodulans]ACL57352.1 hypothetical protein Mnod_2377 [Methylobacterium nodulans ORS 2060]
MTSPASKQCGEVAPAGRITHSELVEMFGERLPIEALALLGDPPLYDTIEETRAALRDLAAQHRTTGDLREAIATIIHDELDGLAPRGPDTAVQHALGRIAQRILAGPLADLRDSLAIAQETTISLRMAHSEDAATIADLRARTEAAEAAVERLTRQRDEALAALSASRTCDGSGGGAGEVFGAHCAAPPPPSAPASGTGSQPLFQRETARTGSGRECGRSQDGTSGTSVLRAEWCDHCHMSWGAIWVRQPDGRLSSLPCPKCGGHGCYLAEDAAAPATGGQHGDRAPTEADLR